MTPGAIGLVNVRTEPVRGVVVVVDLDGRVVFVGEDVRLDPGDVVGEPAAVRGGDRGVLLPVPELHRPLDAADVSAPGVEIGRPVLPPALITLTGGFTAVGGEMVGQWLAVGGVGTGAVTPEAHPGDGRRGDRDNRPVTSPFSSMTSRDLDRLEFSAMGQSDAAEVASWRYPDIYAFYDLSADPEDQAELLDPGRRPDTYFGAHVATFGLIGFVELKPLVGDALEIGLGLRPECAGRGLGATFVRHVCIWGSDRVTPTWLIVRVATFNRRAIRVYERLGFQPTRVEIINSYGSEVEFLRMERPQMRS